MQFQGLIAVNCTIDIIKTENKSKIQSFITFKETKDKIPVCNLF